MNKIIKLIASSLLIITFGVSPVFASEVEITNQDSDFYISKGTEKSRDDQKKIMDQVEALKNTSLGEKNLINYVNSNIKYVSRGNANRMVLSIEDCQRKNYDKRVTSIFKGDIQYELTLSFKGRTQNFKSEYIKNKTAKNVVKNLEENGYVLYAEDGIYYPVTDYEKLSNYYNYISKDIRDYISIMKDDRKICSKDGDWNIFFRGATRCEGYINNYQESIRYREIKDKYKEYARYYLYGIKGEVVFDFGTGRLRGDIKRSYFELSADELKKSRLGMKIIEYRRILQKGNFILNDDIDRYRSAIINSI